MKLLAIDTSTDLASVAVLVDDELICDEQGSHRTHAQLLLPMIDKLMVHSGLHLSQLDGIIFGCGPGSFTGLRIACSIAKGLAYAHDLSLIPVSSLASIAWSARNLNNKINAPVLAVLDARMHEMYWSYFTVDSFSASEQVSAASTIQVPDNELLILAGVGIDAYWDDFPELLKSNTTCTYNVYPNAAAMIQLSQHIGIKSVSVEKAQPVYVRNQVTQGDSRG